MGRRFLISDHALDRFVERHAELEDLQLERVREVLLAELERGVPFGGQRGDGEEELYLLPCGDVAAIHWGDGQGIVKTVLTREHAIANMQANGVVLRPLYEPKPAVIRARSDPAKVKRELSALAERHVNGGVGRRARNAELRALGYDPSGEDGEAYRAAYRKLVEARYAAAFEAHRRLRKGA